MKTPCKCPNCFNLFDFDENFEYHPDSKGHPTIEYVSCPHCHVATVETFYCGICPAGIAKKCELDEECGACMVVSYEEFEKNILTTS